MKRWTFILTTLFLILGVSNCYAVEVDNEMQLANEGRLMINFYSQDSEYVKTPIQGVVIEVLYDDYDGMVKITELPEMQNLPINLVSDYNGNIVINNLPYGLYQYKVISVPSGYEYEYIEREFIIDLLNSAETTQECIKRRIEMVESPVTLPEEVVEEVPQAPEVEKPLEEIKEEPVIVEKVDNVIDDAKVNEVTEIIYKVDNDIKTDKVEETQVEPIKEAVEQTKLNLNKSNIDVISEYKETKMKEAMKDAIVDIDNPIEDHFKMISQLLDDGDDEKKKKKFTIEIEQEDLDKDRPKEREIDLEEME